MFAYQDPVGTGLLATQGALAEYRSALDRVYRSTGQIPRSGFVPLEALDEVDQVDLTLSTVSWLAFPRGVTGTPTQIDSDRLGRQDEYVEWRVERAAGKIIRVTFTTEFPEYYEALAAVGLAALQAGVQAVTGQAPSETDLFGPGFSTNAATPLARQRQFRAFAGRNPWNNGQRDILFLTQQFNTLGALFNLLGHCGVENLAVPDAAVCDQVGGFCGSARNSDPVVCLAAQTLVRNRGGFSLADPPGVTILSLDGIWKLDGNQFDINDPATNLGIWQVTRNGRRAALDVRAGLTMGDDPVTSGTQISTRLKVGATVVAIDESLLPAWAKTGQESTRRI